MSSTHILIFSFHFSFRLFNHFKCFCIFISFLFCIFANNSMRKRTKKKRTHTNSKITQISDIHQFYTRSHEHPIHVDDMEYKMASSSSSSSSHCVPLRIIFTSLFSFIIIIFQWNLQQNH